MFEITYWQMLAGITVVWVIARIIVAIKTKKFSIKRELQLLLVYICIIVIARIVDFPMRHVNGHIGTMKFDINRITPFWINLQPFVHMFDQYNGWLINIVGNIAMFIPVGIIWPACFKKLDNVWKTVLAGMGFTLFIEVTQLLFYERCSDIDDLILNTVGAFIGALIYFGVKKAKAKKRKRKRNR